MFAILGIALALFSIWELTHKVKRKSTVFYIFAAILIVMLCFRYGQGTDYHEYEKQFAYVDRAGSLLVNTLYHGEIGWYMLMLIFKRLGASFSTYMGFISLLMIVPTVGIINRHSPYKVLSLLILYPTYYMTYYYSAVRQGVVIALFLSLGISFLTSKSYVKYYVLVFILALFHTSAIVLAALPIVFKIREKKPGKWIIFAIVFAIIFGYTGLLNSLAIRLGIDVYFRVSISPMAILLRLILFYAIHIMYRATSEYVENNSIEDVLYFIYSFGFFIFIILAFSGTLSQRMTVPMKSIEIILIPMLVAKMNRCRDLGLINANNKVLFFKIGQSSIIAIVLVIIFALEVEMLKNINSYLSQGNYYEWVNVFTYPYISIFNKSDIFEYISHFD